MRSFFLCRNGGGGHSASLRIAQTPTFVIARELEGFSPPCFFRGRHARQQVGGKFFIHPKQMLDAFTV
jgi:hypothetical protein